MLDLSEMRQDLMDRVTGIMNKANEYRSSFDIYAYLWLDDRNEFMRQFLLYNHVLTAEEIEAHADEGVPESPPTLEQFKDQVQTVSWMNTYSTARAYGNLHSRVRAASQFPHSRIFFLEYSWALIMHSQILVRILRVHSRVKRVFLDLIFL